MKCAMVLGLLSDPFSGLESRMIVSQVNMLVRRARPNRLSVLDPLFQFSVDVN